LLAYGWWFSPGTPASSTTNTGRHDIAEILLKVALSAKNQSINQSFLINRLDRLIVCCLTVSEHNLSCIHNEDKITYKTFIIDKKLHFYGASMR
jgi:hypothetical protein